MVDLVCNWKLKGNFYKVQFSEISLKIIKNYVGIIRREKL